uniref:G_PROTEIN_RECEP_F1_2 domain-containing protein n=1 Tax=Strongyloides venezuelensis TaxID=75913 RepID=A0A0K0FEP4_STRVS
MRDLYANTIHGNCGPYSQYKIAGTKDISISVRNILNINCDKANDIPLEPRLIAFRNLMVILTILIERGLRSRHQCYLIFYLAVADSFVGLFVTHLGAWITVAGG